MKNIFSIFLILIVFLGAQTANAVEVDLQGRILNFSGTTTGFGTPDPIRVVGVVNFDEVPEITNNFNISFTIEDLNTGQILVDNLSGVLLPGETETRIGNASSGRIIITFDESTETLRARIRLNLELTDFKETVRYRISVNANPPTTPFGPAYFGSIEMSTGLENL